MVRVSSPFKTSSTRIPHTRGDGPPCQNPRMDSSPYSPHAWGWSAQAAFFVLFCHVFPTRVGMVREEEVTRRAQKSIPHTRGDGPKYPSPSGKARMYSPHAWGWSVARICKKIKNLVFPTRVGMVRYNLLAILPPARIPHTRGDGPSFQSFKNIFDTYSPHAWGWSVVSSLKEIATHVFPTRVGMVRQHERPKRSKYRIPHTRGDGPQQHQQTASATQYSPHAWGWSGLTPAYNQAAVVFPTRVGMVRRRLSRFASEASIPHTRGDGPGMVASLSRLIGIPHTRGDGPGTYLTLTKNSWYSPHAWGWSVGEHRLSGHSRVFPTRVGMVRVVVERHICELSIPHTRGDGPRRRRLAHTRP